jgi:hypothetical protein
MRVAAANETTVLGAAVKMLAGKPTRWLKSELERRGNAMCRSTSVNPGCLLLKGLIERRLGERRLNGWAIACVVGEPDECFDLVSKVRESCAVVTRVNGDTKFIANADFSIDQIKLGGVTRLKLRDVAK